MLDHLVYTVPDLEAGVADVEQRLGMRLTPGGHHERWGTRNALLGLGSRRYLEVIGPDPEASGPRSGRPFGIDGSARPRLATWCMAPSDLDAAIAAGRSVGYDPGEPFEGARRTPAGGRLTWRLAMSDDGLPGDGLLPFLIDWGTSAHPSDAAPSAVTLIGLRGEHPRPTAIRRVLQALGAEVAVTEGPIARLVAQLDTPTGSVELS